MTDEKWQKVRGVFDSALRRRPEERQNFVNQACGQDKTLLAEVESLLFSHDGAESFMETPAVGNKDKAFEYLEKSYQRRELWMAYLQVYPLFDSLRDDPRYADLLRRIGLPQ